MKYWIAFAALLSLLSTASAIQMFYPISHVFSDNESYSIGAVAPGHTIAIITDRGPSTDPYTTAKIDKNWQYSYTISGNNMYIYVTVPKNVPRGPAQICITLSGNQSAETFCPSFYVMNGLVSAEMDGNTVIAPAGSRGIARIILTSTSIGETDVSIRCSLGKQFCPQETVHLGKEHAKLVEYPMKYPYPGIYPVKITVTDMGSGDQMQKAITFVVVPSVKNDMGAMHWGIPISAPILQPIMSLLALVVGR